MRKLLLLMGLSMLGVLMFAPMAWAQDDPCPDPDFPRSTPDGCQASDLPDVPQGDTYVGEPIGAQRDGATPTATPSATPTATSSATTSATATATASAAGAAQYQYTSVLPGTGGVVSPVGLLTIIPAILLLGGGLLSARLIRRS